MTVTKLSQAPMRKGALYGNKIHFYGSGVYFVNISSGGTASVPFFLALLYGGLKLGECNS